jgi:hypothetical protein
MNVTSIGLLLYLIEAELFSLCLIKYPPYGIVLTIKVVIPYEIYFLSCKNFYT